MNEPLDIILCQWARLGILFDAIPSGHTPDIEQLLLATAGRMPHFARLLPTCSTWLARHECLVARHRLARLARNASDPDTSAALGLLLALAQRVTRSNHLQVAIDVCRPVRPRKPLFLVDRSSPAMARLACEQSSPLAHAWGLWTEQPDFKTSAMRPTEWLTAHNPELRYRAIFCGNLRASILACLAHDRGAGNSESALARACGATRLAVREALDHLELCGLVKRKPLGWRTAIKIACSLRVA